MIPERNLGQGMLYATGAKRRTYLMRPEQTVCIREVLNELMGPVTNANQYRLSPTPFINNSILLYLQQTMQAM